MRLIDDDGHKWSAELNERGWGFNLTRKWTEAGPDGTEQERTETREATPDECRAIAEDYELRENEAGEWKPQDEFHFCPSCEESYHEDDTEFSQVYVGGRLRSNTEHWCDSCCDQETFTCAGTGRRYSSHHHNSVEIADTGDTVHADYADNHCYYHGDAGEWYSYPEDEDSSGIPDYHDTPRPREWITDQRPVFGVELETYNEDAVAAYEARPDGWIAERDGSLDDEHGLEFVGPPLLFEEYADGCQWDRLLGKLRRMGSTSYKTPDEEEYGMHVNICRAAFPEDVQAKFVLFVNRNQGFSELVAHRTASRWAKYKQKTLRDALDSDDKYEAVHVRSRVLEVRIFRGTLAWSGFRRNVEFCAAGMAFCAEALLDDLNPEAFCAFVDRNAATYPYLRDFLVRKARIAPAQAPLPLAAPADALVNESPVAAAPSINEEFYQQCA